MADTVLVLPLVAPRPWLRTLGFALVSVAFAVAAHTSAEHQLPHLWLILAAVPAVALALRPIAALEQRVGTLTGALIVVQLMLHALFVAAEGQSAGGAAGWLCCGSSEPLSMSVGAITPVAAGHLTGVGGLGGSGLGGLVLSRAALVQLALHLMAAVILAVLLSRQERALWAPVRTAAARAAAELHTLVITLLGQLTQRPVAVRREPVDPARKRTAIDEARPKRATGLVVLCRHARRGPPALAFLTA